MPYITNIKKYTNGVEKPLKDIISDAYCMLHDAETTLLEYLQDNIFKINGVPDEAPKINDDYSEDYQDIVNKFNEILNFKWQDEDDDLKDLKELKLSDGQALYKDNDLDLKNIKIGNYDFNIIKHQQDRINSLCDKIKSGKIKVDEEDAKKYFLIKFTLDVMKHKIELNIELNDEIPGQIKTAENAILFSSKYRNLDDKECIKNYDGAILTLVDYMKTIIEKVTKQKKRQEALAICFNISEENYNKLLSDPNSIYDFDKDTLQQILDSEKLRINDFDMLLKTLTMHHFEHYDGLLKAHKTSYHVLENLIKVAIPKREWLTKFINGKYDPDKDHEEIKKIDEDFANFLKDTFNAEKLFKSFESDQDKKSLTTFQKLKSFEKEKKNCYIGYSKMNSIAELCSFYHVKDYEDKIPEQSVAEKFNSLSELSEDVFKEVLTDINSGLKNGDVRKKIDVIERFGSDGSQATFLLDMFELKKVLQRNGSLDDKIKTLSGSYRNNSHSGRVLINELKKYSGHCNEYGIKDTLTPLMQNFKKGFLAKFDFKNYGHEGEDQAIICYNDIGKIFGEDLEVKLYNVSKVREFLFYNSEKVEISNMKKYLIDYIDLYKETFKDDLENFGDNGKQINNMLEGLGKQIENISNDYNIDNNKDKIKAWAKCTFFCIGTLCTSGLLAFLLINDNVRRTVFHPIQNAKFARIRNVYNETIKQTQDLNKKINGLEK